MRHMDLRPSWTHCCNQLPRHLAHIKRGFPPQIEDAQMCKDKHVFTKWKCGCLTMSCDGIEYVLEPCLEASQELHIL